MQFVIDDSEEEEQVVPPPSSTVLTPGLGTAAAATTGPNAAAAPSSTPPPQATAAALQDAAVQQPDPLSGGAQAAPSAPPAPAPHSNTLDDGGGSTAAGLQPVVTIAEVLKSLRQNAAEIAAAEEHLQQLLSKQQALMQAERCLEQDRVINVVPDRSLGFSKGRPVAAILIARCLHQWGALGVSAAGPDDDASALLRRFSDLLARQLQLEDEAALAAAAEQLRAQSAYWLSVTAGLMVLIIRMAMHAAAGNGGAEGRGLGVKRSVAQLQRRLADRVGELHLGTRLNDGLHQLLWARSKGKGPTPAAEASAGPAAAASNEGAATTAAEYAGQGDGGSGNGGDSGVPPAAAAAASEASVYREPHPSATSASSVLSTASTPVPASPAAAAQPKLLPPASIMHQLSGIRAAGGGGAGAGSSGVPDQLAEFIVALDAILQRAFTALRDQLRRRLLPLLANCMQFADSSTSNGGGGAEAAAAAAAGGYQDADLDAYRDWAEIVCVLSGALDALRAEHVPLPLVRALMQQILAFINVQLFNQLLLRPEICSTRNARHALRGLKQIDGLLLQVGEEELGPIAWQALNHTRQALQFLALERKGELSLDDISQELCPTLSHQQLYRLCTTAWDDGPSAESVSGEVLEAMHARYQSAPAAGGSGGASSSPEKPSLKNQGLVVTCLLDEPLLPPFAVPAGTGGSGSRSPPEVVLSWDGGRDYAEGISVPKQLLEECPEEVFAFLQDSLPL